jgi:NADH dehydrogenase
MSEQSIHAVTGAFGYSGKYITQKLLDRGYRVITLTNSLRRENPFGERVRAFPFNFDKPEKLIASLKSVAVLYNTYWVRFDHKMFNQADAIKNTIILFNAAKEAGVQRIVHISITNPSVDSKLEYFSGKAKLEEALIKSGLHYSILRPAVLFGKEDILINNIAWALRTLPVFGVFGDGQYCLKPIYVEDLAELAVEQGKSKEDVITNAIGPETFTYKGLVKTIGDIIGKQKPIVSFSPNMGYLAGLLIGKIVGDVMITRDEITGLMNSLLYVDSPPVGKTKLTEWVKEHRDSLGRKYTSELARRKDLESEYKSN